MASALNDNDEMLSAINVTPFVDIVLVLLIILMVTSVKIVQASFPVDLPTAASAGDSVESTLNIVVTSEGELLLDGNTTSDEQLAAHVQQERAGNAQLQAVIAADRAVPYDRVVHVIDLVKSNGVTRFALNIQRDTTARLN